MTFHHTSKDLKADLSFGKQALEGMQAGAEEEHTKASSRNFGLVISHICTLLFL